MKKKVLSLILSVLMICLAFPASVFAEEEQTPAGSEQDPAGSEQEPATSDLVTPTENWLTANLSEDGKTLTINNASDLLAFANALAVQPKAGADTDLAEDQFHGKTIVLTNDVNLNPSWSVASTRKPANLWPDVSYRVFTGVFDGQDHTLSGIYLKVLRTNNDYGGIFGCARSYDGEELVAVKNLAIINSCVEGGVKTGSIFGSTTATKNNVLLENLYVKVNIKAVANNGTPSSNAQADNGGLIGFIAGTTNLTIKNTVYAGTIDVTAIKLRNTGGFAGRATNSPTISIENSAFYGTIKTTGDAVAGLLARTESNTVVYKVKDCIVAGSIELIDYTRGYAGTFYGQLYKELKTKITVENSLYTGLMYGETPKDQPIPVYGDLPDCLDASSTYHYIDDNAALTGSAAQALLDTHSLTEWMVTDECPIPKELNGIIPDNTEPPPVDPDEKPEPDTADVRYIGYQLSAVANNSVNVRLVGVIDEDDLQYEKVGVRVIACFIDKEGAQAPSKKYETSTVYTFLLGTDESNATVTYQPQDYNGSYFFALTYDNVTTALGRVMFKITTFHVANGETVDDGNYEVTVDFAEAK